MTSKTLTKFLKLKQLCSLILDFHKDEWGSNEDINDLWQFLISQSTVDVTWWNMVPYYNRVLLLILQYFNMYSVWSKCQFRRTDFRCSKSCPGLGSVHMGSPGVDSGHMGCSGVVPDHSHWVGTERMGSCRLGRCRAATITRQFLFE